MESLEKLSQLNEQSDRTRGHLQDLPWEQGVDPSKYWIPEPISHLYHLPVYQKFTEPHRRTYNQAFALMLLEQFVRLEEDALMPIARRVLKAPRVAQGLTPDFRKAIENFLREEKDHVDMFWNLLHRSDPRYQGRRQCLYFKPSPLTTTWIRFFMSLPDLFIFWVWIVLYFEERFIQFYREIRQAKFKMDPLHSEVHRAHLVDEARHVQLDEYFVKEFWDPAPLWVKRANVKLLGQFFHKTMVNSLSARGLWARIVALHPEMDQYTSQVLDPLKTLPTVDSYQETLFGRKAVPRVLGLFDERPECHALAKVLKFYHPKKMS